jgi:hypothetical protein
VTVAEDVKAAREIVRTSWHKGGLYDGRGNVCAIGAIRQGITGKPTITLMSPEFYRVLSAEEAVVAKLPAGYGSIAEFNDAPSTTHQDVLNLFDKTLADLGGLA